MRPVFATLCALALHAVCAPAAAQPPKISVVETLRVSLITDNRNNRPDDDNFGQIVTRTDVMAAHGPIDTRLRLDGLYLHDAPTDDHQNYASLERITVIYRVDNWRLEAGDYHLQLGRGIVLSLKPIETAGIDTALRGGHLEYKSREQTAGVFAGVSNPMNFDIISRRYVEETEDVMFGGRYNIRLGGRLPELGVYGMHLRPDEQTLDLPQIERDDQMTSGGISLEAPRLLDWAALYAEVDYQQRIIGDHEDTGSAAYATLDLSLGETQVLIEALYLDGFEQRGSRNTALASRFEYNRPPTIERFDQEVFNNRDVRGGRVRAERWLFSEDFVFHGNAMYRVERYGQPGELHQIHFFGGVEADLPQRLSLSGGWREEALGGFAIKRMLHAEGDYAHPIGGGLEVHLSLYHQFRVFDNVPHARGSFFVGLEQQGAGGLTFEIGYDDQNPGEEVRNQFYAGLLSWRLGTAHQIRSVIGTQRGGIKCVSGVCRDYPAFAGAHLEWIGRF